MKVLFIDDEKLIRRGLQATLDWKKIGFDELLEAEDGESGLEVIRQENPQLVLMDIRMDDMDGTEVARRAREAGFRGRIIIISGYSDFSYAQSAISSDVTAYLLKPVDPEELLKAVSKALSELEKEKLLTVYESQSDLQTKQNIYTGLLSGKIQYTKKLEQEYELGLEGEYFWLGCIYAKEGALNMGGYLDAFLKECQGKNRITCIEENRIFFLGTDKKETDCIQEEMEYLAKKERRQLYYLFGNPFYDIGKLSGAYRQIKELTERIFYYADKNHICRIPLKEEAVSYDIVEETARLVEEIICGRKQEIERYQEKIQEYLFYRKSEPHALGFILGNIVQEIEERVKLDYLKGKAEHTTAVSFQKEILKKGLFCEYMDFFAETIQRIYMEMEEYYRQHPAQRICSYIQENYGRPLKLEQIAEELGYNSIYLGKMFRSETGVSFNTYLEQVRLEKAKEFLKEERSIVATAEEVGYRDIDYFSKKFKKYTGVTPSEYRKNHK